MFLEELVFSGMENSIAQGAVLGGLIAFIMAFMVFFLMLSLVVYVYLALSWMAIGKKMKYKHPWFSWIPFLNIAMFLQLGNFHWAWVFLILIPFFGWVALSILMIVSMWRIFKHFKYPGELSLLLIGFYIPYVGFVAGVILLILFGFLAWGKKR